LAARWGRRWTHSHACRRLVFPGVLPDLFVCLVAVGLAFEPVVAAAVAYLRLQLNLSPAHRDGAAGLGFLSESLLAFAGFAFAVMATTAGEVADYVVYDRTSPLDYKWEVGSLLVVLVMVIAGPLLLFVRKLYEAKDSAVFEYGALASRQIQEVDRKWLSRDSVQPDAGIDFRSVAHLGSSLSAVREMSIVPLYKDDVLKLLFVALLPYFPLLITLVPMDEVWSLLLKVLV
jgi:hypothetical protein